MRLHKPAWRPNQQALGPDWPLSPGPQPGSLAEPSCPVTQTHRVCCAGEGQGGVPAGIRQPARALKARPHQENMQFHTGLLLAAVLSLQLAAAAQALWCHQCTGFGGCSRGSRCPRDSTHCVTTATRVLSNIENLPLVTKMCHTGCPDIPSLRLGPYVSIACCQTSLCNHD
ncbi:hypothetical protein H8959_003781 [Pygathrix nigripes]